MPDLAEVLQRLGLAQYQTLLSSNGFESWEVVLDITEEDLKELGFKIGHRRTLQREIASFRGIPPSISLFNEPELRAESSSPLPAVSLPGLDSFPFPSQPTTPTRVVKEGKRRYRRHPKADANAPKKPRTAYVNFADNLRLNPAVSSLSFVDIAREVGRQWQNLPAEEKHRWECAAARAMQDYEMQMEEYKKTDDYQRYQDYLDDFRQKQLAARERKAEKADLLDDRPGSKHDHDGPSRASSGSPMSLGSVATPEMDKYTGSMTAAMRDLDQMRLQVIDSGVRLYDSFYLPPEDLVRGAASIFLGSTSSVLFAWPMEQVQILLSRMYDPVHPPDPITLAEGFILAALGGYYPSSGVTEAMRKTLHASAAAQFNQDIPGRSGYLRTMRLFLCFAYYSTLEKHMSVKYLTSAGLQLARWKFAEFSRLPDREVWHRVYRTLAFMDAWISFTLGFNSDITPEDASNVCLNLTANSADDVIQHYSTSIMIISAEVSTVLQNPENCTPDNVKHLLRKIEQWNRDLHPVMQLPNITSHQPPFSMHLHHRQAALMVHILYLNTIIHLYAHLLAASTSPTITATWSPSFLAEIQACHVHTASAATQMAQILAIINASGQDQRQRWWARMHASYISGVSLLYSAATKMLNAEETVDVSGGEVKAAERVEEDLRLARVCMDTLAPAAPYDPAANHLLNLLRPAYSILESTFNRSSDAGSIAGAPRTRGKSSIYALLDDSNSGMIATRPTGQLSRLEIVPMIDELGVLLRDPCGKMREGWLGEYYSGK